jgi:hypothetical protein
MPIGQDADSYDVIDALIGRHPTRQLLARRSTSRRHASSPSTRTLTRGAAVMHSLFGGIAEE